MLYIKERVSQATGKAYYRLLGNLNTKQFNNHVERSIVVATYLKFKNEREYNEKKDELIKSGCIVYDEVGMELG